MVTKLYFRYEIPIICFSILFAEGFPSSWEGRGAARRLLNEVWKWGAMIIVLVYRCNLRSHLIKGSTIKPPRSIEELGSTRYTYKVLIFFPFKYQPEMIPMQRQNRQVVQPGMTTGH